MTNIPVDFEAFEIKLIASIIAEYGSLEAYVGIMRQKSKWERFFETYAETTISDQSGGS